MSFVVDASAVLAYTRREEGCEAVRPHLTSSVLSVVNLAEVQKRMIVAENVEPEVISEGLRLVGVTIVVPDERIAAHAARFALTPTPKGHRSISLADGFCIAQAEALDLPLLTADRIWAELPLPVRVELAR